MAPYTVTAQSKPGNPASGGHFVQTAPGQFQLIHAIGVNKWAPGPPAPHAATQVPAPSGGIPANSPLLNPNQTLSGKALLQAAQGLVDAQTVGPLAELAKQIANNNSQTQSAIDKTGGYFQQLGAQTKQGADQAQSIGQGLNTTLQGIGQGEQSALQGLGQGQLANLAKYAPQSDAQNSLLAPAAGGLASEIARQQGLAAQNQAGFQSFGATQGANASQLANSQLGTFGLKGQEALKGVAQAGQLKNEPLMGKVANIQAARGSDLTKAIGSIRQQEVTNGITRQGLGIRQQANTIAGQRNAITAQNNIANQNLANKRIGATIRGQNITESTAQSRLSETTRHDQATEALNAAKQAWTQSHPKGSSGSGGGGGGGGGGVPGKGLTTNEQLGRYTAIDKMTDVVKALKANGSTPGQIWRFMTLGGQFSNKHGNFKSPGYPSWAVQAAYDLATYGYINKTDAANLAKNGLTQSNRYQVR